MSNEKNNNENFYIRMFIAGLFLIGAVVIPKPDLNDLVYFKGQVVKVAYSDRSSILIALENDEIRVNLPTTTIENKKKLKALKGGKDVEVWYLESNFNEMRGVKEVWQFKEGDDLLIDYKTEVRGVIFNKCFLLLISLLFMFAAFKAKRSIGQKN